MNLPGITRALVEILRGRDTDIVVTQPYEGGHPDHDATAFAVNSAAVDACRCAGPAAVEMTSYQPGPGGLVRQRFVSDPCCPETVVPLAADALAVKRRMFAPIAQARQLANFTAEDERCRRAPDYDFTAPANSGAVHYDRIIPRIDGLALVPPGARSVERAWPAMKLTVSTSPMRRRCPAGRGGHTDEAGAAGHEDWRPQISGPQCFVAGSTAWLSPPSFPDVVSS